MIQSLSADGIVMQLIVTIAIIATLTSTCSRVSGLNSCLEDSTSTSTSCADNYLSRRTATTTNASISHVSSTTTTTSVTNNNDKTIRFHYARNGDLNASYPVIEYFENITDSSITAASNNYEKNLPAFLVQKVQQMSNDLSSYKHYYVMFEYYKPYCEACNYVKETYIKTASYMKLIFEMDSASDSNNQNDSTNLAAASVFDTFAINCQANPHLCTSIHSYPTIQIHDMKKNLMYDIDFHRLHPYTIMERIGFDDTEIHMHINQLAKYLHKDQHSSLSEEHRVDNIVRRSMRKDVVQDLDYIYNHMKPADLEIDLHVTVDTMLRYYTYVPKNKNMTNSRSLRDPPLNTPTAQALRAYFDVLIRVLSPIKNTRLQRLHSMIKELLSNFIYIANHAGYIPAILDEFYIQPEYFVHGRRSNKVGKNQMYHYSKDCAPDQPIIITPNDDDSGPNGSNMNRKVETDISDEESFTMEPYLCGLWKLLFHVVVGGGWMNYNAVSTNDSNGISDIDMTEMIRDYATNIGFGIWSDHEIQIVQNTTFRGRSDEHSKNESSEMRVALWLGTIRNEIQKHRYLKKYNKSLRESEVQGSDFNGEQWPSKDDCPHCWMDEPVHRNASLPTNTPNIDDHNYRYDRPIHWNDETVFKYIQLEYGTPPDNFDLLLQLYAAVHPEELDTNFRSEHQRDEL